MSADTDGRLPMVKLTGDRASAGGGEDGFPSGFHSLREIGFVS